ncbi:MAG: hypothetical protein U9N77_12710 [Thermodesulfobacteriota bacterium]|nr:hypothetical protein [Thermodesulfobacteriota bacterium]
MKPFYTEFYELAEAETRYFVTKGDPELPDGSYGFVELFCEKPNCDCHRVSISVFCDTGPDKILATLGYGWKNEQFYEKFLGGSDFFLKQDSFKGPYLDPLHPQSEYSQKLLLIFKSMVKDKDYEARLERHYLLFKEAISKKQPQSQTNKKRLSKVDKIISFFKSIRQN